MTAQELITELGGWRTDTWNLAFKEILKLDARSLIETGCFRGTITDGCSTVILAAIAKEIGGTLDSYELNQDNIELCKQQLVKYGLTQYVTFHQGDSILNLALRQERIDFAYLDSFDCGLGDHDDSQRHQLAEFEAVLPLSVDIVLLDDNIKPTGGKTALTTKRLNSLGFRCVANDYQVLYSRNGTWECPKKRFGVLCGHLDGFAPLAVKTIYHNKGYYCTKHGYDLNVTRKVRQKYQDAQTHATGFTWSRLEDMLELLESGRYEWVWCVGGDTLVTNMDIKLETLVDVPETKHVIACAERVAPIQADSFLVRSSKEGKEYLKHLLSLSEYYRHHPWVENQTMIDTLFVHSDIVEIVPQHRLNAYEYSLYAGYNSIYLAGIDLNGNRGQWNHGDFLVHWPGTSAETRTTLIAKYEPMIVESKSPRQLDDPRPIVVYPLPLDVWDTFRPFVKRFTDTFRTYPPGADCIVWVMCCNDDPTDEICRLFRGIPCIFMRYDEGGQDIGAAQYAALQCYPYNHLIVGMTTRCYFHRKDWLKRIVDARAKYGPGLYGTNANTEGHRLHISTHGYSVDAVDFRKYPMKVKDRETACLFEHRNDNPLGNFLEWMESIGRPGRLVMFDGVYEKPDWFKPKNRWRDGDQSNVLVWDKHTDIYKNASEEEKRLLEQRNITP